MDYKGKKCLIAYFSHAGMNYVSGKIVNLKVGNTEQAAKMIGRMTGGDLFHIRAAAVYPHEYKETVSLARHEWEKGFGRPCQRILTTSAVMTSFFSAIPIGAEPCLWPCGPS